MAWKCAYPARVHGELNIHVYASKPCSMLHFVPRTLMRARCQFQMFSQWPRKMNFARNITSTGTTLYKRITDSLPEPNEHTTKSKVTAANEVRSITNHQTHNILGTGIFIILISMSSSLSPTAATNASSFPFGDNLDVLKHVLTFVGENQYRFIAGVNRCFQCAYSDVFPENKCSYLNASTEKLARFCWSEMHPRYHFFEVALCRSAAAHGNIQSLQFLRSVHCRWDAGTCAYAARYGHLKVLQ